MRARVRSTCATMPVGRVVPEAASAVSASCTSRASARIGVRPVPFLSGAWVRIRLCICSVRRRSRRYSRLEALREGGKVVARRQIRPCSRTKTPAGRSPSTVMACT